MMTKVEKHAEYVMDQTDMAVMAFHEKDSNDLTVCVRSDYSEFIGAVAFLIWNAHTDNGVPLAKIGEDLNSAVKLMTEMYEE